ncbi:hypothetical protein ACO0K3_03800 [Undibacterium sp. Rencai35W]|uniref:hypothetical protein n=1 Tax=Undibacterium sp. Rencai35W TaxID=3413046 RepID=UPI003BF18752
MRGALVTHGHTRNIAPKIPHATPEYKTWCAMKARCNTPGASSYAKYGARGIKVCERWQTSFEAFLEDMGIRPSNNHSIDRINPLGNYELTNCRWATLLEQANNKTSNRVIEFNGTLMTLAQWSRLSGVDADVISLRITKHGWDIQRSIFEPERHASSGVKGIYWQSSRRKWAVSFMVKHRRIDLGRFDNLLDAVAARLGNQSHDMMASVLAEFER